MKQSAYDSKLKAASSESSSAQPATLSLLADPFERPNSLETAPYRPRDALCFFDNLGLSGSPSSLCLIRNLSQSSMIFNTFFRKFLRNDWYFGSSATMPSRLLVNLSFESS